METIGNARESCLYKQTSILALNIIFLIALKYFCLLDKIEFKELEKPLIPLFISNFILNKSQIA